MNELNDTARVPTRQLPIQYRKTGPYPWHNCRLGEGGTDNGAAVTTTD